MASKLKCPKCKRVLKEAGDNGKIAQGEYIVIEDKMFSWNRMIECLGCAHRAEPLEFEGFRHDIH